MTLAYQSMRFALMLAAPMLLTVLIVGLVVSVFQAATQINEMTLSFIPKLLALCAVLVVFGPWLIASMTEFIRTLIESIPTLVQ